MYKNRTLATCKECLQVPARRGFAGQRAQCRLTRFACRASNNAAKTAAQLATSPYAPAYNISLLRSPKSKKQAPAPPATYILDYAQSALSSGRVRIFVDFCSAGVFGYPESSVG